MKKHLFAITCVALALNACGPVYVVRQDPPPAPAPAPSEEVSYQSFYDQLAPYGQWIDYPGYGNVWQPNVGPDFKPYATNGYWVYSDAGWVWASNYNWGWATFHYGRWFYEDGYGWMWIPGNEWAPAWVSWRRSPDYYGWAPLGPNVSISVSIGGGYNPPPHYWNFVPQQYVTSPNINNYYVEEQKNVTIINSTTVINNTTVVNNNSTSNNIRNTNVTNNNTTNNVTYNNTTNNRVTSNYAGGPDPREVERLTGAPLKPVVIRTSNTPGPATGNGNGQLAIYRPRVNAAPASSSNTNGVQPKPAPARVIPFSQARPVNTASYSAGTVNQPGTLNNRPQPNPPVNQAPATQAQVAQAPIAPAPAYRAPVAQAPVAQTVKPPVNQPTSFNPNAPHPGQRGNLTHVDSLRMRTNGPVKPLVKPKPPVHPGDDKTNDDDKKKDKKDE